MKKPVKIRPGDSPRLREEKLNYLFDYVKSLELYAGVGTYIKKAASGTTVAVAESVLGKKSKSGADDCTGGDLITLGVDEAWSRVTDNRPVKFTSFMVDYDPAYTVTPATGRWFYREREVTYDRCGNLYAVSAFCAPVTIAIVYVCA